MSNPNTKNLASKNNFTSILERYIRNKSTPYIKKSTLSLYSANLKKHVFPYLNDKAITGPNDEISEEILNELINRPSLTNSVQLMACSAIKWFFCFMLEEKLIYSNVAKNIRVEDDQKNQQSTSGKPKQRKMGSQDNPYTPESLSNNKDYLKILERIRIDNRQVVPTKDTAVIITDYGIPCSEDRLRKLKAEGRGPQWFNDGNSNFTTYQSIAAWIYTIQYGKK